MGFGKLGDNVHRWLKSLNERMKAKNTNGSPVSVSGQRMLVLLCH
jgi:hypothetical protein